MAAILKRGAAAGLMALSLLAPAQEAQANNWINPVVSLSAPPDGQCIYGSRANSGSTDVTAVWTAENTDPIPGRAIQLSRWDSSSGAWSSTGSYAVNAPVGQLPPRTTTYNVTSDYLLGSVHYAALRDAFETGLIWSDDRSPLLSPNVPAPGNGQSGLASIDLSLDPDCFRPSLTNSALPNGRQNSAYSLALAATDGVTPYSFSVSGLPAGLSLSGTTISGTPTVQGTFPVVVRVTGQNGGYEQKTLSLTIDPPLYTALMTGDPQAATTTNPNPSIAGANFTLGVHLVSSSSSVSPTGTITATSVGWSCSGSLTQGATAYRSLLEAACPALPVGTHSILVSYSGDSQHTPNSITISHTVVPEAPVVGTISPPALTTGGGNFTIVGSNLSTTTGVTVDGVPASFTITSNTQLSVVAPATTMGAKTVEVTTAGGTATGSLTFYTQIVVNSVSTYTMAAPGGTTVTLGGTGFVGLSTVLVNGTAATSFTVDSDTSMSFVAPAGTGGPYLVRLGKNVVPGVDYQRVLSGFAYADPLTWVTTSLPDATLGSAYNQSLSATGGVEAISYSTTGILPVGLSLSSGGTISGTPTTAGTYSLELLATSGGESVPTTLSLTVTANAPTLTGISGSNLLPTNFATNKTVNGTNLAGVTTVTVGGNPVAFTQISNTQVTVAVPSIATDGEVTIAVTTPGGTATIPLHVYRSTFVTGISPSTLPTSGGNVTITGTGFTGAYQNVSEIYVGSINPGSATNIVVVNDTTITATFPPRSFTGLNTFFVVKPLPSGYTSSGQGNVTYEVAPAVTSPQNFGLVTQLAFVTGSDLNNITSATLGGLPVTITNQTATRLDYIVPANATLGLNTLALTYGGGTINADVYVYTTMVIQSASPALVGSSGGTEVTLTGFGFVGPYDIAVIIDGNPITPTVVSDTQMRFTAPPLAVGSYSIYARKNVTPSGGPCCTVEFNLPGFQIVDEPAFTTASLPEGQVGAVYSQTITATSGATPYDFAATGLPGGLSMNSAGTISGTPTEAGTFSVTLIVTDNNSLQDSLTLPLIISKTNTSLSLASSANPAVLGTSVTFTATLTGGSSPTGDVEFFDGATSLGTATLTGGAATLATAALTTGSHQITASYAGDSNNAAADATALTQVINPVTPTLSLASSANPAVLGTNVTFTATLTGGSSPTGDVEFFDGATSLGTATLTGGTATLATAALTTGSHQITASYAGDTNNAAADASALTQVINPVTPTLSLASSANPAVLGTNVTFTATLTGGSSPTGDVEFFDGATSLGTATLTGGTATFSTATLALGSHPITSTYPGDTNNTTATATALTQVIVDVTPPSVQLSAISGPVGGVYTTTATFSEPVTGFVAANLTLTNATASVTGGNEVFTLTLTPLADGTFSVAIPAGAAQDLAGNDNTASNLVSADHDATPPTIVSSQLTGPVGGIYTLRLTFSEPVTGLSASEIVATNATVTVSGSGTDYVIEITPVQDGQVSIMLPADRVQDTAGNGNAAASLASLTHITVYPSVTLSTTTTGITSRAPITVSAAFSESVTGLTLGEITVSGGSATALTGLGQSYDITILPSGVGDVTVQIPADVAQSSLGAGNLVSNLLRVQGQIVALTEERVTTFMLHRADALLASQPDLISRLRGAAPGAFDIASRGIDGSFVFRNSWQSGIWADIHGRWNSDAGLQSDYLFGVLGAEFVTGPRLIFGAMLQFDRMTTTDATGFVRGQGWLVGPYVAGQIGDNPLFYEARLLYGQSRNRLSIDNGLTISSFETERWLGSVRLAGEMTRGALTFTPSLAISQTSDSHDGFIDGYGNPIAAQSVSLLQGELGLDVRRVYALERGLLTVNGGGSLVFSDGGLENLTSSAPIADTRGRAWLGFGYDSGRGLNWTGELRLDGLGTGSITPQIGLTWRLDF